MTTRSPRRPPVPRRRLGVRDRRRRRGGHPPHRFEFGSRLAAHLALVGGVAQIAFGVGQAWLADGSPRQTEVRAEVATFQNHALQVVTLIGIEAPASMTVNR